MMKNTKLKLLAVVMSGALFIVIAGCNGLGKMVKNAGTITYEVTPKPLELHGDSVAVTIKGKYPPKYFNKKAAITVTPVLTYAGGEKAFKSVSYKGEASKAEGTVINYASGGSFSYTDKVAYTNDMKVSELKIKAAASVKTKSKEFPGIKIADGVITTPLLVMQDDKPILGADKFTKTVPRTSNADIHFVVNQSNIRPAELKMDDVQALNGFIKTGAQKGYAFMNVEISAYASPDGEERMNAGLAERRAEETAKYLAGEFKRLKLDSIAKTEGFFKKTSTPEDWEGFKRLMEKSDIKDKDLILRVLGMYSDLEQREKEIKNLAATYTVVAENILPQLRRSQIRINAEERSRTDEQLTNLVNTTPDSLSLEEILYAATLTNDLESKLKIYQSAARIYPEDWRGFNNTGYVYLLQNKLNDAQAQFEKANSISAGNPVVTNNLGVVAHLKGDRNKAAELFREASSESNANYNLGIIEIQNGNYESAVSKMAGVNSFNAALAKTLAKNNEGALTTLEASPDKDSAMGYYLKAIIAARSNNNSLMVNSLKSAINKDASLKAKAKDDLEFMKYRSNSDFTALVN